MSIEALWAIRFASLTGGKVLDQSGGVLVLETERLFGGDSGAFYTGRYKLDSSTQLKLNVHVGVHDPSVESTFGGPLVPLDLTGTGKIATDQKRIDVVLTVDGKRELGLVAVLTRVAELP